MLQQWYIFLCLKLVYHPLLVQPQFIQTNLCESQCHCQPGDGVVDCNRQDQMQGIPTNLPLRTTKLYIQGGYFNEPSRIGPLNMSGLEMLEELKIIYCNLQVIEPRTFMKMTKLVTLDLSNNLLHRVEAFTFYGLRLTNLYLQKQRNGADPPLKLVDGVFVGLTATQIDLRGNSLASVNFELFSKVANLERLILSDNRIKELDNDFEKYFDRKNRLLDLTGNPLECNCKLSWIALRSADWVSSVSGLNITCVYHYDNRQGVSNNNTAVFELRRLTADQLCPTSRIHHIEVNIGNDASRAVMDCTAVSIPRRPKLIQTDSEHFIAPSLISHTPPIVAWRYVEGGHSREIKTLRTKINSPSKYNSVLRLSNTSHNMNGISSTVRLNVSIKSETRNYTCVTIDDNREAEEVVVTLHGPSSVKTYAKDSAIVKQSQSDYYDAISKENSKQPTDEKINDFDNGALIIDEPSFMFQKRFSTLEMVIAVTGTFIITFLLLLMFLCICARFRLTSSYASIDQYHGKGAYSTGKVICGNATIGSRKTQFLPKQNGLLIPSSNPGLTSIMQPFSQNHLPQQYLPGLDRHATLSPHINPLQNLPSNFLATVAMSDADQAPSSIGTDDLQLGLSRLTSASLFSPGTMRPIVANEAAFSPYPPQLHQSIPFWTTAPGSPYSNVGSNEYDMPKVAEQHNGNLSNTLEIRNHASMIHSPEKCNRPVLQWSNQT